MKENCSIILLNQNISLEDLKTVAQNEPAK